MSPDDAAYVADLVRGANHHYAEAVALLTEAGRIAGGEPRDAVPVVYLTGPRYYVPPGGDPLNPELDVVGGYACPIDPMEALECTSCQ